MKIHWNNFKAIAVQAYPKEACSFLFSKKPYNKEEEEWFVIPVKNIAEEIDKWIPDHKDMHRIKRKAKKLGLVKLGNIHTHTILESDEKLLLDKKISIEEDFLKPSETDLKYANKFNDIVRGIIVIGRAGVQGIRFHDKFDNEIKIEEK